MYISTSRELQRQLSHSAINAVAFYIVLQSSQKAIILNGTPVILCYTVCLLNYIFVHMQMYNYTCSPTGIYMYMYICTYTCSCQRPTCTGLYGRL